MDYIFQSLVNFFYLLLSNIVPLNLFKSSKANLSKMTHVPYTTFCEKYQFSFVVELICKICWLAPFGSVAFNKIQSYQTGLSFLTRFATFWSTLTAAKNKA